MAWALTGVQPAPDPCNDDSPLLHFYTYLSFYICSSSVQGTVCFCPCSPLLGSQLPGAPWLLRMEYVMTVSL